MEKHKTKWADMPKEERKEQIRSTVFYWADLISKTLTSVLALYGFAQLLT